MISIAVTARADTYAEELKAFASGKASTLLTNEEFAIVAPALIIAFQRQAAACAVAYGETFGADPTTVIDVLHKQIDKHFYEALASVREAETVQ